MHLWLQYRNHIFDTAPPHFTIQFVNALDRPRSSRPGPGNFGKYDHPEIIIYLSVERLKALPGRLHYVVCRALPTLYRMPPPIASIIEHIAEVRMVWRCYWLCQVTPFITVHKRVVSCCKLLYRCRLRHIDTYIAIGATRCSFDTTRMHMPSV